jgi:chromosome partitioning protein
MNKVIVVAHQKGGVGKSTIASNIAVELSKFYNVRVVDLDLQKSLTYFNNLRKSANLTQCNIVNISSPNDLKELINNNTGLLIIDAGGYDSDINRVAISGADILVTPVSDSGIELVGLLAFRQILRDIRKVRPDLKSHVLLNKIHQWANASLNEIFDFIKNNDEFTKFNAILRDRADYKKSFDAGKSVIEYNNRAVDEMNGLISEIKTILAE